MASIATKAPRLGRKPIYLYVFLARFISWSRSQRSQSPKLTSLRPNFEITLLRNPKLPPNFASFIVPLNFNKLDLRDYLWNGYGVYVKGVRSYVQMQKIVQSNPKEQKARPRNWFRPRSIKKMMVEMDKPFVWPEVPEDLSPYVISRVCLIGKDAVFDCRRCSSDFRLKRETYADVLLL